MLGCARDCGGWGLVMRFILLVILPFVASVSAAAAADVLPPAPAAPPVYRPPPASPAYNWSGFYIGAMGGYGWNGDGTDLKGGFGGGTIGGNAQFGAIVVGAEVEGAWADITHSASLLGVAFATDRVQAFGSVTARAGVAVDNL